MVMAAESQRRVLAKLSDVTQELTVGVGSAMASVRTLTGVSLEVRERELVVLSGSRGAGERAVLAVLAGDRRGVTGHCEVAPKARVRLMRIGAQAALALTQEWQRAETLASYSSMTMGHALQNELQDRDTRQYIALNELLQKQTCDQPPDLILLDVVPLADNPPCGDVRTDQQAKRVAESGVRVVRPWNEKNRGALLAWAAVCHLRGGAVVMAAGDAVGNGIFDSALRHVRQQHSGGSRAPSAVREVHFAASSVRVVPMHCGRLAASVRLGPQDLA